MVSRPTKNPSFEKDSITYLRHIKAKRVMLVCDPGMVQFGYAALVKRQLELNRHDPMIEVSQMLSLTHLRIRFIKAWNAL